MANAKMIGVLLGTLTLGNLVAVARAETPANDKGKAAAKPDDKKGGQKSCGGANGCGADKSGKENTATDKGKTPSKPDDKKGGQKSCGGANGCGAKH